MRIFLVASEGAHAEFCQQLIITKSSRGGRVHLAAAANAGSQQQLGKSCRANLQRLFQHRRIGHPACQLRLAIDAAPQRERSIPSPLRQTSPSSRFPLRRLEAANDPGPVVPMPGAPGLEPVPDARGPRRKAARQIRSGEAQTLPPPVSRNTFRHACCGAISSVFTEPPVGPRLARQALTSGLSAAGVEQVAGHP